MRIPNLLWRLFGRETTSTTTASAPRYGLPLMLPSTNAMAVSTVYACVNLLANSVAGLPLRYLRLRDGVFAEDTNSRLHYLLTVQPCAYMNAFDFWHTTMQYILLRGNAYIVPIYSLAGGTAEVERLALCDPAAVAHDTINDVYTINDTNAGVSGTFTETEVIHLKNFSYDGKQGLSTIGFARQAIDVCGTGDLETLNRFRNGGNVRGLVSNDTSVRGYGEYQDSALKKIAAYIYEHFKAGEYVVAMPGQTQFHQMSMSSADLQFLETRKFGVIEICRFFGVHPSFVFADTSTNYKSAENANAAFLSNTLNPILRRIETELHRKLISPSLCCKRRFEFDRRGLFAADLATKVAYQTQTIAAGIYTVNDWRKAENMPPVEGGDVAMVSANLKPITDIANSTDNGQEDNTAEPVQPV